MWSQCTPHVPRGAARRHAGITERGLGSVLPRSLQLLEHPARLFICAIFQLRDLPAYRARRKMQFLPRPREAEVSCTGLERLQACQWWQRRHSHNESDIAAYGCWSPCIMSYGPSPAVPGWDPR